MPVTMATGSGHLSADAVRSRRADQQAVEEDAGGAEGRPPRRRRGTQAVIPPPSAGGRRAGRTIFLAPGDRRPRRGARAGPPLRRAVRHRGAARRHVPAGRHGFCQLRSKPTSRAPMPSSSSSAAHTPSVRRTCRSATTVCSSNRPRSAACCRSSMAAARRRSGERSPTPSTRNFSPASTCCAWASRASRPTS